jgi:hypothetical protein
MACARDRGIVLVTLIAEVQHGKARLRADMAGEPNLLSLLDALRSV